MLKKKTLLAIAALPLLIAFFGLQSCTRDMCEVTMTYTKYTPVYMSYEALRAPDAIGAEASRVMENPGKIYVKDRYLFVNELRKGIHIIDNTNPSAPQMIAFLRIPGNRDLSVFGDVLYADSHVDVVSIDISDPTHPVFISRVENALEYDNYENYTALDPSLGVVNEWIEEEVTETMMTDCNGGGGMGPQTTFEGDMTALGGSAAGGGGGNKNPMTAGKGGSMARFTIVDHYLYTIGESNMDMFDISSGSLTHFSSLNLGFGIETIFPYNQMLFIGTTTGMQIFDNSNPANPTFISEFMHVTSCDPVVVDGNFAYVSLRGGTPCGFNADQVHVVDISTPTTPTLVASYDMDEPYGLGIDQSRLFVCDGPAGVKLYDATTPGSLSLIKSIGNAKAYDVIPFNNILYVIAEDGISQYDYTNTNDPAFLSRIPVGN
jgi:hypothetical protein